MRQLLCFGDSNTWGYNPENGERFPWGVRWTSILQERLQDRDMRIIEEGLCGRTTVFDDPLRSGRNGAKLFPTLLESHKPDTIVIMLGTNDCKTVYSASPEVIGKGVSILIEKAKEMSKDSKILLISPIHLGEDVWHSEYDPEFSRESVEVSKRLTEVYRNVADQYGVEFLAASDVAMSSIADQEHMNPEGHRALAQAVEEKLYKLAG
jgi:lysophospholipase L1-like esterase